MINLHFLIFIHLLRIKKANAVFVLVADDKTVGEKVEFEVLLVSDENGVKLGADVAGVKAVGEVVAQDKFRKVVVYKYKAKKNIRKKQGHRQPFTAVKIENIG